jgi:hypothetical protein
MAYFIFLKYLRSLEEFRKNPHVKILPRSPRANFQSLGIFKNLIFIRKGIFFRFWPIRPSPARANLLRPAGHRLPARPTRPKPCWRICRKAYSLRLCTLRQRRLLSLMSLPCGARLSAPSPSPRWPTVATSPRLLRPPHAAQLHPRMPPEPLLAPPSSPPLNPPLNLAPVLNGVKAINAAVTPPGPYKRVMRPPSLTAPHPLSPKLLRALFSLATSSSRRRSLPPVRRLFATARASMSTSLAAPRPARPSPSPVSTGELQPLSAPPRSTMDSGAPPVHDLWTHSTDYSILE